MVIDGRAYAHVKLAQAGHQAWALPEQQAPEAKIDVSEDGTGLFIYPAATYRGAIAWRVSLVLDAEAFNQRFAQARLEAYGIEMVYIPEAAFTLGDPDTTSHRFGAFYESDASGEPKGLIQINSEDEIAVGPTDGALHYRSQTRAYQGDQQGPIPEAFPKGFQAFYVMKYELTQGHYAAFLNTLSDNDTFERFSFGGRTYYQKRGTIRLKDDRYMADRPDRPLNFSSWDDGLAFADWAGLRPMTELEFTKASRGPNTPLPHEFPWGTSSRDQLVREVGPDDDLIQNNGWDESLLSHETRPVYGASYYWVMDLAGSVWERVITIGQADGRAFAGSHGDGSLGDRGRANNLDWPHDYNGAKGHGYRGGGFYDQGMKIGEFNPHSPIAYRRFGGWAGSFPYRAYGFRCARTAP